MARLPFVVGGLAVSSSVTSHLACMVEEEWDDTSELGIDAPEEGGGKAGGLDRPTGPPLQIRHQEGATNLHVGQRDLLHDSANCSPRVHERGRNHATDEGVAMPAHHPPRDTMDVEKVGSEKP